MVRRAVPRVVGVVLLATLALSWSSVAAVESQDTRSRLTAKQLFDRATSSARALGSVHAVSRVSNTTTAVTLEGDIGEAEARRVVTIDDGTAEIRLAGGVVYLTGDQAGLAEYFGFPAEAALNYADRWVSVASGDTFYDTVVAGVTLRGVFATVNLGGKLTAKPATTRDGRRVIPISGTFTQSGDTGKATMYVSAGKKPLPVEFVGSAGDLQVAATFTDWGAPVSVDAPVEAIPYGDLDLTT